jgi:hypothetical protein
MDTWWNSLTTFELVAWSITLPVTLIFAIQTVLTFAGVGGHHLLGEIHHDFDGSHDHGSFQLFNFRNFINFFLGFGWSLIALNSTISNRFILITLSCLIGIVLVAIVMSLFYGLSRMSQSGNLELKNAIGQVAEVYLTIPASQSGIGKIHIKIQGALRELDAMASGQSIPTGQWVKVTGVINDDLLLVEPLPPATSN